MIALERAGSACTKLPKRVRRRLVGRTAGALALVLAPNRWARVWLGGLTGCCALLGVLSCTGARKKRSQSALCQARPMLIVSTTTPPARVGACSCIQRRAAEKGKGGTPESLSFTAGGARRS